MPAPLNSEKAHQQANKWIESPVQFWEECGNAAEFWGSYRLSARSGTEQRPRPHPAAKSF